MDLETDSIKFELGGNAGAKVAHHVVAAIKQVFAKRVFDNIIKTVKHMIL